MHGLLQELSATQQRVATKNETMVEQHHQSTADALRRAESEHTAVVQTLTEAAAAADVKLAAVQAENVGKSQSCMDYKLKLAEREATMAQQRTALEASNASTAEQLAAVQASAAKSSELKAQLEGAEK